MSGGLLDDVRAFELYHDSTVEDPKEDADLIRERLTALAEREGIEYEAVDTADMSDGDRNELHHETAAEIRAGREYHVGNRVFTGGMFGSRRPVLVIRYEEGVDIYPHRNGDVTAGVIGVLDFLDEVEGAAESDEGDRSADYAVLRRRDREEEEAGGPESDPRESESQGQTASSGSDSDSDLLSKIGGLLPG